MKHFLLFIIIVFILGCTAAKGPIISIDKTELAKVKRIAVLPILNITEFHKINPLLEQLFFIELTNLRGYEFVEPKEVKKSMDELRLTADDLANPMNAKSIGEKLGVDAVAGIMITTYTPFKTEEALVEKREDAVVEAIKGPKGLLDLLVPDWLVKKKTEYRYAPIAKKPSIGALTFLVETKEGKVIYNASKFITEDAVIPGAYSLTYGKLIPKEELNRIDFIARLMIKELIEPLRR